MKRCRILMKRMKIILALTGLVLFVIPFVVPPDCSSAERQLFRPEWVMPEGYPEFFHGWGRIGYIGEDEISVNDIHLRLSPSVTYHTPTERYARKALFTKGKLVGFLFNDENEIISLWLITMEDEKQ
jgi:hypothetical protein